MLKIGDYVPSAQPSGSDNEFNIGDGYQIVTLDMRPVSNLIQGWIEGHGRLTGRVHPIGEWKWIGYLRNSAPRLVPDHSSNLNFGHFVD